MGISIKDTTATFIYALPQHLRELLPVNTAMVGKWFFADNSSKNEITNATSQIIGTPVFDQMKMKVTPASGFVTDVSLTTARTHLVIAKFNRASKSGILFGEQDYSTTTGGNVAIHNSDSLIIGTHAIGFYATVSQASTAVKLGDVLIVVASYSSTGSKVYVSDGTTTAQATGSRANNLAASPLRFGAYDTQGTQTGMVNGAVDLHLGASYNKVLTEAEVLDVISKFSGWLKKQNGVA